MFTLSRYWHETRGNWIVGTLDKDWTIEILDIKSADGWTLLCMNEGGELYWSHQSSFQKLLGFVRVDFKDLAKNDAFTAYRAALTNSSCFELRERLEVVRTKLEDDPSWEIHGEETIRRILACDEFAKPDFVWLGITHDDILIERSLKEKQLPEWALGMDLVERDAGCNDAVCYCLNHTDLGWWDWVKEYYDAFHCVSPAFVS